ncbi:FecR family protein [Chitinophaga nivalis]|uniref:FecR domain-containing protein n=1 Tax=Chitinophaga nivalis TaxID=2991709 RepID=A0ABT3IH75_9BACT|nr:FecR family protein [Chitinophaga nivalis]MCW3467021.1 FecR domain-containing protein [Chitinophaga nivalis]MCW3483288.1 FecR domain-containing protein [Chitinophaga nivalis]
MQHINPELIRRYHAGACSLEEKKIITAWLEQEDNFFTEGNDIVPVADPALEQEIWQKLMQHPGIGKRRTRIYKMWVAAAAAACMIGLLVTGGLFFRSHVTTVTTQQVAAQLKTYTAPKGSRSRILLADSSVVHLMSGSTIQFPENFDGNTRDIHLTEGEIFLEVARRPEQPFMVHSSGTTIRVLGTTFNVRNTASDPFISVMLTTGCIQFAAANNTTRQLKPGQELLYNKSRGLVTSVGDFPAGAQVTGWTKGILRFDNLPLSQVLKRLGAYYGVQFIPKGNIDWNMPLTATVDNLSLEKVLSMLEFSTALKFTHKDDIVGVRIPE